MTRYLITIIVCALLAACTQSGNPLPLVSKSDPTWTLPADHLDFGSLPE